MRKSARKLVGKLVDVRLAVDDAERARKSHADAIRELQVAPAAGLSVIRGVVLPNVTNVVVSHKLGRSPVFVGVSIPRRAAGFGAVIEVTGLAAQPDRAQSIVLQAGGYSATVTVDVIVL